MIALQKNKLQVQFEQEKAQLERYGYVSSLTFEDWMKCKESDEYDIPETSIKDSETVTSRMRYIDDDLKPIAEFIISYADWDLRKDKYNHPVAVVPLFRVLDALLQRGNQYCEGQG